MIQVVLIDVDNTLLDFDACVKAALRDGFAHFGLPPYEENMFPVFTQINNQLWHRMELGEMTRDELLTIRFNHIFSALGIDFDGVIFEEYFRRYLYNSAIHVEGALDLLRYLSEKYIVCAASNGPYEQQLHRLRISGLAPYLKHCFISEQVGAEKPSRQFFEYCMKALKGESKETAPENVMMIGDSLTADMAGGINYGMKTCWYDRSGKGTTADMAVDFVVRDLAQIHQIL